MICALLAACDTYEFLNSIIAKSARAGFLLGARLPSDEALGHLRSLKEAMKYDSLPYSSRAFLFLYDVTDDLYDFEVLTNRYFAARRKP